MSAVVAADGTRQWLELARFLGAVDGVPSLPQVTRRILDVVNDPAGTPRQLHDIILHDPALAARVLKVVNSAFYGVPRRVGSIERAILVLGAAGVKTVSVAASLGALFAGTLICDGFTAKDLWLHSIAVAVAAGYHHRASTGAAGRDRSLVSLVRIADTIYCQAGYGFNLTAVAQPLDLEALRPMRVDPMAVDQTRHRLGPLVTEAMALLG